MNTHLMGRKRGRPREALPSKGALRVREFRRRQKLSGSGSSELSADEFHDLMVDWMHRWRHADMERLYKKMEKELAEIVERICNASLSDKSGA